MASFAVGAQKKGGRSGNPEAAGALQNILELNEPQDRSG
jgi:hypothetical protein